MKILAEKESEKFLKDNNFKVIESFYAESEKQLDSILKKISFPIVMKASGKEIIHKKKINGIKLNILDYDSALSSFGELMKINASEGVLVQKQIFGKEFILGIKNTPEFGQIIVFGAGGSRVEEIADVSFRVCPLTEKDALDMIKTSKIGKNLNKSEIPFFVDYLFQLCSLAKKYPGILELDINPLIYSETGEGLIVDARISFED